MGLAYRIQYKDPRDYNIVLNGTLLLSEFPKLEFILWQQARH